MIGRSQRQPRQNSGNSFRLFVPCQKVGGSQSLFRRRKKRKPDFAKILETADIQFRKRGHGSVRFGQLFGLAVTDKADAIESAGLRRLHA